MTGTLIIGAGDAAHGIYRIVHLPTNREYIGQTSSFRRRFREHRRMLETGKHHAYHLQRAWNKYGPEEFAFEPIATCPDSHRIALEQVLFDEFCPAFNVSPTAGSTRGVVKSAAQRAATSARFKGKKLSPEHVEKIRAANKGHVINAEQRRRLSEAHKGKVLSAEHKAKLSAALKGRIISPEHREKQRIAALARWARKRAKREAGI